MCITFSCITEVTASLCVSVNVYAVTCVCVLHTSLDTQLHLSNMQSQWYDLLLQTCPPNWPVCQDLSPQSIHLAFLLIRFLILFSSFITPPYLHLSVFLSPHYIFFNLLASSLWHSLLFPVFHLFTCWLIQCPMKGKTLPYPLNWWNITWYVLVCLSLWYFEEAHIYLGIYTICAHYCPIFKALKLDCQTGQVHKIRS